LLSMLGRYIEGTRKWVLQEGLGVPGPVLSGFVITFRRVCAGEVEGEPGEERKGGRVGRWEMEIAEGGSRESGRRGSFNARPVCVQRRVAEI
jgi:hypothetical protein